MEENTLVYQTTDMDMSVFATLSAIKGRQFNRDIYSAVIKFKDLDAFLEAFDEVQRKINPRQVASIKRYIISGLDESIEEKMRFFPAMTCTCRGTVYYDAISHRMAIDTRNSKISINDGQHRAQAVKEAIKQLEKDFVKSRNKERTASIRRKIEALNEMIIPVTLFDNMSIKQEKQMFCDINNLAQRPSKNTNIRLNQINYLAKLTTEIANNNRYLKHYGVEMNKSSIQKNNFNTFLLATIYDSVREILQIQTRTVNYEIGDSNYKEHYNKINETFDQIFYVMPPDLEEKGKYITEKAFVLKAICRFVSDCRYHLDKQYDDEVIFDTIKNIDWTHNLSFWEQYGGFMDTNGKVTFPRGYMSGYRGIYNALAETIKL